MINTFLPDKFTSCDFSVYHPSGQGEVSINFIIYNPVFTQHAKGRSTLRDCFYPHGLIKVMSKDKFYIKTFVD